MSLCILVHGYFAYSLKWCNSVTSIDVGPYDVTVSPVQKLNEFFFSPGFVRDALNTTMREILQRLMKARMNSVSGAEKVETSSAAISVRQHSVNLVYAAI